MCKPTVSTPSGRAFPSFHRAAPAALATALAVLGLQAVATPGSAQTICGERTEVVSELNRINAEMPKAIGLAASGALIELLVSPSGDWTLLVTYPSRETCFVATGEHWETIPVVAAADPEA